MKKKSILIIVLCILVVIFAIFIAREIIIQSDGSLNKSNPMAREEVIELLKKGKQYPNYYYSPEVKGDTIKTEYYIKDNMVSCFIDGNLSSWTDYNEGKEITLWNMQDKKLADIRKEVKPNPNSQYGFDYSKIVNQDFTYQYLGEKIVNERNAIVVQLSNKSDKTKFYIDKETGVILATADFYKQYGIFTSKMYCDRNVKFDNVTEENVKMPDLSTYTVREVIIIHG